MKTKMKNKFGLQSKCIFLSFLLLFFFIFLINFVSAVSTEVYVQTEDTGIIIEYPKIFILKQNQDFHLRVHVFNKTSGIVLTNESTNCTFNLYDFSGEGVLRINNLNFGNDTNSNDCQNCFNYHVDGSYFSNIGRYSYLVRCKTENLGGAISIGIEVTPTGLSENIILYIIFFAIFYGLTFLGIKIKNPWVSLFGCFGLLAVGIYTLTSGIAVYKTFVTDFVSYISIGIGLGIGFQALIEITDL